MSGSEKSRLCGGVQLGLPPVPFLPGHPFSGPSVLRPVVILAGRDARCPVVSVTLLGAHNTVWNGNLWYGRPILHFRTS